MIAIVVDDSAAMRRIEQKALEAAHWEVRTATNGEEALTLLQTLPSCDLVITDWHMPVMDGLALVRAVRLDPRLKPIRILMITSESVSTSLSEAMNAGADDILMKPFSVDALCERITEVMNG